MRKWYTLAVAGVIAATFASAVDAQLSLWFDVRDSIAAINAPVAPYTVQATNGGGRGDGQVCYISPTMSNDGHLYRSNPNNPFHDASQRTLTLYGDFTGNTGEVLSSLGLDIAIAAPAASPANRLASVSFTAFNAQADVGVITSAMAWDGTNAASLTPSTTGLTNFRAVRVPVAAGPVFDPNLGIKPGQGYRLARLGLQGAARVAGSTVSTLGVKMSVGELLITRVSQTGADPLPVNFGYFNGAPEAANGNGSTQGATSANDDATIIILQKGDYVTTVAGTPSNGSTNNLDINPFIAVRNAPAASRTQRDVWLGDFDGNGTVDNLDIQGFLKVRLANP